MLVNFAKYNMFFLNLESCQKFRSYILQKLDQSHDELQQVLTQFLSLINVFSPKLVYALKGQEEERIHDVVSEASQSI